MIKAIVKKYLNKKLEYYKYQCESLSQELGCASYIPQYEIKTMEYELNLYRSYCRHLDYVISVILVID